MEKRRNNMWEKIKKWFLETAVPWLKKGAIQIINVLVVLYLYGQFDNLLNGQEIHAVPLSSYVRALEIANILKEWIEKGEFLLTQPQETLPTVK